MSTNERKQLINMKIERPGYMQQLIDSKDNGQYEERR